MGKYRVDPQKEVESIFLILGRQFCTQEHIPNGIANCLVRAFSGTVLRRSACASWLEDITVAEKESLDTWILASLATEVNRYDATRDAMGSDAREEHIQPIRGYGLALHW
jgi:hypothetical protein